MFFPYKAEKELRNKEEGKYCGPVLVRMRVSVNINRPLVKNDTNKKKFFFEMLAGIAVSQPKAMTRLIEANQKEEHDHHI